MKLKNLLKMYFWWLYAKEDAPQTIYELSNSIALKINVKPFKTIKISSILPIANAVTIGPMCRKLILTKTLLDLLTIDELKGVLLHEYAHCKLKHGIKLMIMIMIAIPIILFIYHIFDYILTTIESEVLSIFLSIIIFISLYITLILVTRRYSRKFEIEADIFATNNLENPMIYLSILRKIKIVNNHSNSPKIRFLFSTHPSIDRRIEIIKDILYTKQY